MRNDVRVLTPAGMLGYGFPVDAFADGVAMEPDVITVDSGSTDSGPQKLGLGSMTCSREAYVKDLTILLDAAASKKIPLYVTSAGGDGSDEHVDVFLEIVREIARRDGHRFRVAAIYAGIPKTVVHDALREGRISPLGPVPPLTGAEIDAATTIVGQMGAEPLIAALADEDPDIIIAGRAYDPVPIAVQGLKRGFDPGLAWHMGKIMECGALCAQPRGKTIFGVLSQDGFELPPLEPHARCTVSSVAAHSFYEKSHPTMLPGPGGTLDVSQSRYEQLTDRTVRVSGSVFRPSDVYTVKLEGAKTAGYRSIFIGGIRDPILIDSIDDTLARVEASVRRYYADVTAEPFRLIFHVYGKNGVMGELEPITGFTPLELCVILEVSAPNQQLANAICGTARTTLLHADYPGRIATAGNMGSPFTPLEIPLGPACEFNIYHIMEVGDPVAHFPIRHMTIA